jgi:hypothetical protein
VLNQRELEPPDHNLIGVTCTSRHSLRRTVAASPYESRKPSELCFVGNMSFLPIRTAELSAMLSRALSMLLRVTHLSRPRHHGYCRVVGPIPPHADAPRASKLANASSPFPQRFEQELTASQRSGPTTQALAHAVHALVSP